MSLTHANTLAPSVLPLSSSPAVSLPLHALTSALARGDDSAWMTFHREYGPRIFRQLLAATRGDHPLASDALQQAYLRIARHARPCDSEAMFLAWLRIVARSALSDCLRKRRSFWQLLQRRHADPSDTQTHGETGEEHLLHALEAALASLDPEDRTLLEAKYFGGIDVRSLAEERSISFKAAESRLSRARAELRRRFLSALADHEQENR